MKAGTSEGKGGWGKIFLERKSKKEGRRYTDKALKRMGGWGRRGERERERDRERERERGGGEEREGGDEKIESVCV